MSDDTGKVEQRRFSETREFLRSELNDERRLALEEALRRDEMRLKDAADKRDHELEVMRIRARNWRLAAAVVVLLLLGGGALWYGSSFSADLWGAKVELGERETAPPAGE